jgi:hypothetical protein
MRIWRKFRVFQRDLRNVPDYALKDQWTGFRLRAWLGLTQCRCKSCLRQLKQHRRDRPRRWRCGCCPAGANSPIRVFRGEFVHSVLVLFDESGVQNVTHHLGAQALFAVGQDAAEDRGFAALVVVSASPSNAGAWTVEMAEHLLVGDARFLPCICQHAQDRTGPGDEERVWSSGLPVTRTALPGWIR